jgi:hypothetical protein
VSVTLGDIPSAVRASLVAFKSLVELVGRLVVNIDLNGRVRLIAAEAQRTSVEAHPEFDAFCSNFVRSLAPHAPPRETVFLFEENLDEVARGASSYPLDGLDGLVNAEVEVVDRLATDGEWGRVANRSTRAPRMVFFSIKGGVGRSTALAVTAAALAERGSRVLVLDLDLASPGLSTGLLPSDKQPSFGVVDWLVEDLVDNGDAIIRSIAAVSPIRGDREVIVVPAFGTATTQYIAKLGRAWMPKGIGATRESWSQRLARLIDALEGHWNPDIVLVDARSGIDDLAAACVTQLGAAMVLLFGNDSAQTWQGYSILFEHLRRSGATERIRERVQCVGAASMVDDEIGLKAALREAAWNVFLEYLYEPVGAGELPEGRFSFDLDDDAAPHAPWLLRWDRAFLNVGQWQRAFGRIDSVVMHAAFGPLIEGAVALADQTRAGDA